MMQVLSEIQKKLNNVETNSILQYLPSATITQSTLQLQNNLTIQLQPAPSEKPQETSQKYIVLTPSSSNELYSKEWFQLENRIAFLEKLIASEANTNHGQSLYHRLELLEQKTKMLENPQLLDSLKVKLHQMQEEYSRLPLEQKDGQWNQKMDELYNKTQGINSKKEHGTEYEYHSSKSNSIGSKNEDYIGTFAK